MLLKVISNFFFDKFVEQIIKPLDSNGNIETKDRWNEIVERRTEVGKSNKRVAYIKTIYAKRNIKDNTKEEGFFLLKKLWKLPVLLIIVIFAVLGGEFFYKKHTKATLEEKVDIQRSYDSLLTTYNKEIGFLVLNSPSSLDAAFFDRQMRKNLDSLQKIAIKYELTKSKEQESLSKNIYAIGTQYEQNSAFVEAIKIYEVAQLANYSDSLATRIINLKRDLPPPQ